MKKSICMILSMILVLALSACSGADAPEGSSGTPVTAVPPANSQTEPNTSAAPVGCVFDPAQFDGKIQRCAYAGDGKLLVEADKLYLYDTAAAAVLAVTETPLSHFETQCIDGGYVLSGMDEDGMMMTYIYDNSLSLSKELAVNELLTGDNVVSETCVAASTDGKKLAVAAMCGLYLYDLEQESLSTLLAFDQNADTSAIRIAMPLGLAFAHDNSRLVFYAGGFSASAADGEGSFSIYGSVAVDGSGLKLTKSSANDCDEIQRRASRLFSPATFIQNNGTLAWLDGETGSEQTLSFFTGSEGSDGVYSSEQGNYAATAVLDGNLTVRVYDVNTGELIATEVIENSDSTYFSRTPRIYILEEAKTAMVLLGGSISEIDTLVSTFTFGE